MKYYFLLLFISISTFCFSQTDTEFWFVAPEVTSQNGDQPILLRLTTYGEASSITINQPANTSFQPIHIDVPAFSTRTVDLTPFKEVIENKPGNQINPFGIFIKATKPITSFYEVANESNSAIFTLKGKNALGNQFYIPAQNAFPNDPGSDAYSSFDIVAIENNSIIEITPTNDIIGHPKGVKFSIILNRGETYSAVATSKNPGNHLMGSFVASAKPLAITVKDDAVLVNGSTDLNGDQIVSRRVLGNSYIIVRGNLDPNVEDRVFITNTYGAENRILIDGDPLSAFYLASGETYSLSMPASRPVALVQTDVDVYIQHQTGFGYESASAVVPSINCTGSREVAFARTNETNYTLLITTQEGMEGNFAIDGNTSLITKSQFSSVPGILLPKSVYARISFSTSQLPVGAHIITNNVGNFNIGFISSTNGDKGCGYGYLSDYSSVYLGPNITMCPGTSKTLDAGQGKESYLWSTGETTQKIEIKYPGTYYVTTGSSGCYSGADIFVTQFPSPVSDAGSSISVAQGTTVSLSGNVNNTNPPVTYYWTPENSIASGNTTLTPTTIPLDTTTVFKLHFTDWNGCTSSDAVVITVVKEPGVCDLRHILNNDTTVCAGSTLQLNSRPALTYQWYPVNGLNNSNVQRPTLTSDSTRTYNLTTTDYSNNLVNNPNFELGNTGFITTYTNCNSNNCLWPLADYGYSVGTDARYFHSLFTGKDHTTGSGNFMIINGANPSLVVWKQTISVAPNTDYAFGVWINTMIGGSYPLAKIRFSVNGTQLGSIYTAPGVVNQWDQVFTTWNSGVNTEAIIEIVDVLPIADGNDFGLDDIFFGEISSCIDSVKVNVNYNVLVGQESHNTICSGEIYTVGNNDYSVTGTYIDILSTVSGCDSIITTNLTVNPSEQTPISKSICEGESFTIGTQSYSTAGIYVENLKTYLNCDSTVTINLTVNPLPIVALGDDKPICPGDSVILSPGDGYTSYLWSDSTILNKLIVTIPGNYVVTAFNEWCPASDEISINECGAELWFPNAFSPDNDGINERFKPVILGTLNTYEIIIYNRWGQELYESNDAYSGWDGIFKGSLCAMGQYVYIATYSMGTEPVTQKQRVERGTVTLVR